MKDYKYIASYTMPLMAILGLYFQGIYSYLTPIYAFGFIPLIELFTPESNENLSEEKAIIQSKKRIFDWFLYLNVPIIYGILITTLYISSTTNLQTYEIIGFIISCGIILSSNGINVGHELGHRNTVERFIGKALLLPSLYMHFFIEHNHGHHKNVGTPEDSITAKYNQNVYHFWITSVPRQYISAWKIQSSLLKQSKLSFFSVKNDMFWYTIITILYVSIILIIFGVLGLQIVFFSAVISFLLLETTNYVEHYALVRAKNSSGRYERVQEIHSWNSNHLLGRIMIYEVTRHSDHHHRATKKYQLLDHHDESPQLPFGYSTAMFVSFIPPLWFWIINKRVPETMKPK